MLGAITSMKRFLLTVVLLRYTLSLHGGWWSLKEREKKKKKKKEVAGYVSGLFKGVRFILRAFSSACLF